MIIETNLHCHTQTIIIKRTALATLIKRGKWRPIVDSLKAAKRYEGTTVIIRRV